MFIYQNISPTTNKFNDFLAEYGMYLAIGIALILLVIVLVIVLVSAGKNRNKKVLISNDEYFNALGGKENIISKSIVGSRISLELSDYSKVDDNKLKTLGVDSIIRMSKKITLVIKGDSNSFFSKLN